MTVITVNRVQSVYNNPVYDSLGESDNDKVLAQLVSLMKDKRELDMEYYKKQRFNSVHIGDFKLKGEINHDKKLPTVSVLMPVYNTPVEFLSEAVESIINQTFGDYEFIIIDDGSTDPAV